MMDLIKKHMESYARGDWDAYAADLADDAVYHEVATGTRAEGKEEFVKAVKAWKNAFSDLKADIRSGAVADDKVFVELEWEGTHDGTLEGPFGSIPPSGERGKVSAAQVITIRDGKIAELHHYFDLMTVLRQMGVGMPSRPEERAGEEAPAPA